MSASTFRLPSLTAASTTSAETKSAAIESPAGKPSAAAISPAITAIVPDEVAAEVERVREQRLALVPAAPRAARPSSATRRSRARARSRRTSTRSARPRTRGRRPDGGSQRRAIPTLTRIRKPCLGERGEVLRLAVTPRVAAVGRANRDGDGEERQQRGGEVRPRVRRLREQAEARARDACDELDRDEQARGPDRDERGAALRRHSAKATACLSSGRADLPELRA